MATPLVLTAQGLDTFKDKLIKDVCPLGFIDPAENHCAHFAGHVLKLNSTVKIGLTCDKMISKPTKFPAAGACLRVHELFNACDDLSVRNESGCLIYVTKATNISPKDGTMGNIRQKHVGIYFQGNVWDYSNDAGKVLSEKVDAFITRIDKAYGGHTVARFTVIPDGADFLTLAQVQALAKP